MQKASRFVRLITASRLWLLLLVSVLACANAAGAEGKATEVIYNGFAAAAESAALPGGWRANRGAFRLVEERRPAPPARVETAERLLR